QPIAAAPPNLRDEMCGGHRKRPAAEEADDEESVQANSGVDPSSAYAVTMQSLRGKPATGPLLGPMAAFVPIPVFVGPPKPGSEAAVQIVARPSKKKPATATAAVTPADPKNDTKPATVNASAGGFSLTPSIKLPGTGTFAPASAETKPIIAPERGAEPDTQSKPKKKRTARPNADAKAK